MPVTKRARSVIRRSGPVAPVKPRKHIRKKLEAMPSPDQIGDMTPEQRAIWFGKLIQHQRLSNTEGWIFHPTHPCEHVGCQGSWMVYQKTMGFPYEHFYCLVRNSTPEPDGSYKMYALRSSGQFVGLGLISDVRGIPQIGACHVIAESFGRHRHGWYPQQET